jgi:hypothetical protein
MGGDSAGRGRGDLRGDGEGGAGVRRAGPAVQHRRGGPSRTHPKRSSGVTQPKRRRPLLLVHRSLYATASQPGFRVSCPVPYSCWCSRGGGDLRRRARRRTTSATTRCWGHDASGLNVYDIRIKCETPPLCYDFSNVDKYLNQEAVREVGSLNISLWVSYCYLSIGLSTGNGV